MRRVWSSNILRRALPVVLFLFLTPYPGSSEKSIYCGITPEKYLTGRFVPAETACFVNLTTEKIPAYRKNMYLRREAATALKKMIDSFKREHPDIKLYVRSATRTFYDQRWIWHAKWNGRRLVGGKKLNKSIKDHRARALKILEYSSMPGTSRHHWGTDVDFNRLTNAYYEKAEGKIIFKWLKKNAASFGFVRPYTAGRRQGYNEEKWHWSWLPLARPMLKDWNRLVKPSDPEKLKISFRGLRAAWPLASLYVNAISGDCR